MADPAPTHPERAAPRAVAPSGPARSTAPWLAFCALVMVLAVARRPAAQTALAAALVFVGGVLVDLGLARLAVVRGDGRFNVARCLALGPVCFFAIVTTGGLASPAWMCAYPGVMAASRERTRTALLLTALLYLCELAAWLFAGIGPGLWPEVAGRGLLLLASALLLRSLVGGEDQQRRAAADAVQVAERASASKHEAEARFRLAEQSATHSKMASLGLLAASVAHEINNPINTIINSAQIILDGDAADVGDPEHFQRLIISEAERVARVVSNLLQFARGGGEEYGPTPLLRVIEKTLMLIQFQLDKDHIDCQLDVPADLPPVRARMEELQQVYLNLLTNARYALLEKRRLYPQLAARIAISARAEQTELGLRVVAIVHDNGTGIAPSHLARVFEPFFSTKPRDEGTGLGLSVCARILREHRGRMEVKSVFGKETTFTIFLPAHEAGTLEHTTGMRFSAVVP